MTPQDVITEVRRMVNDTRVPYRYSDTILLGFVNQTLLRMSVLRPDIFSVMDEFTTTPDTVLQDCPADSVRLVEIFGVVGGDALMEVSRDTMDQSYPAWRIEAAGIPVNFMRHVRNANKYFLYPAPIAGITLSAEYIQTPPTYAIGATITAPSDSYFPIIVDGTIFLTESIDDEHVSSGRAKLFLDSFVQALGVGLQSRAVTDLESAGLPYANGGRPTNPRTDGVV